MSDTAIREGTIDYFIRAEQSGLMEQWIKEGLAASVSRDLAAAQAEIAQIKRQVEAMKCCDTCNYLSESGACLHDEGCTFIRYVYWSPNAEVKQALEGK